MVYMKQYLGSMLTKIPVVCWLNPLAQGVHEMNPAPEYVPLAHGTQ